MESEGPYRHSRLYGRCVGGCMACIYAAGRKSMEKDFKELLELATRMYEMLNTIWLSFVPSYKAGILLKFYAWKKARGIE